MARVREGPGVPRSPLRRLRAPIGPLTFYSMDDSLSPAACGSVALTQVRLGVSRAPPGPGTACPRGACREA
jgi:hypothetical protein